MRPLSPTVSKQWDRIRAYLSGTDFSCFVKATNFFIQFLLLRNNYKSQRPSVCSCNLSAQCTDLGRRRYWAAIRRGWNTETRVCGHKKLTRSPAAASAGAGSNPQPSDRLFLVRLTRLPSVFCATAVWPRDTATGLSWQADRVIGRLSRRTPSLGRRTRINRPNFATAGCTRHRYKAEWQNHSWKYFWVVSNDYRI